MYVAVLGIFFVLGAVFVLISRIPALMRALNRFDSWDEVAELAGGTPAAGRARRARTRRPTRRRTPTARPCASASTSGCVTIFSQAIQITLVGVGLTAFFVLFGFLAIPEDDGRGVDRRSTTSHVLAELDVGGRTLVLTEPLLRVAGFLGAFSGDVLHRAALDRRDLPRGVRRRRRPAVAPSSRRALRLPARLAGGDDGDES